MIRSQELERVFRGEITAFLVLIFVLMLSVVGALVESASIHIEKNCKRVHTMLALESTFAEYNRALLERYDVFARYGNQEDVTKNRLPYYGASGITHQIEQIELLTDHSGKPYYEAAVSYMKDWYGLEDLSLGPDYELPSSVQLEKEEDNNARYLQAYLEQENASLPQEENPIISVQNLKKTNLLSLLVAESSQISNRSIRIEDLVSKRQLKQGNYQKSSNEGVTDKVFFAAYLTEHFSNVTKYDETHPLLYEQEYLLGGAASDRENLELVCKKLLQIRMLANYTYLLTDSAKQAEAEVMAGSLCTIVALPEITMLVKQGILLAWAYGESIVDVRQLLRNQKIPIAKTKDTWQVQLKNLVKLGTAQEVVQENNVNQGLGYEDYLKGLLMMEKKETLCMRSLDLIESNLQIKADQCMTKIKIASEVELRRGVQETFITKFGYQ